MQSILVAFQYFYCNYNHKPYNKISDNDVLGTQWGS